MIGWSLGAQDMRGASHARSENELSDMLGRNVDLRTAADLSPHFRAGDPRR
jgi:predicted nucleotidyltransferase